MNESTITNHGDVGAVLGNPVIPTDRFLAALVESSDDAIITKTLDGRITSWNRAAEALYGYSAAEAVGRQIALIVPSDRPDELPTIMDRLRRGERIDHFETVRVRKDGTRLDLSLSISPIRDDSGQIVGAASIGRDITEAKRIERERRDLEARMQTAARQSEAAMRETGATLEIINQVGRLLTAELDLEALVQSITDAARSLTGAQIGAFCYTALDESGRDFTLFAIAGAPRDVARSHSFPRDAESFGPVFRGGGGFRSDDVRRDPRFAERLPPFGTREGRLKVVSFLAVPVKGRDGQILGGLFLGHAKKGMFDEQAERVAVGLAAQAAVAVENGRLYRKVQQELEARRHMEAEKEAFLEAVAHDLANPLTALNGQAQLLRRRVARGSTDAAALDAGLAAIIAAAERVARMLSELSDVARLAGDRPLELNRAKTDLLPLVQHVVAEFQGSAPGHQICLETTACNLVGHWDGDRLMRVLENLIANAIKYSPRDSSVVIRLARDEAPAGSAAVLVVADQGVGIPASDVPFVFERFRRGGNVAGRISGTGLGLWGSHQIVTQHGGAITIDSTESVGTAVTIRLPLATGEDIGVAASHCGQAPPLLAFADDEPTAASGG